MQDLYHQPQGSLHYAVPSEGSVGFCCIPGACWLMMIIAARIKAGDAAGNDCGNHRATQTHLRTAK